MKLVLVLLFVVNHYYPFGLTMAGISSKALNGILENKKQKFQGQEFSHNEFSDGSGLDMYEFKWRMHDPQTGRFWQIDPLAEKYVHNSTYAFSENKVIAHVELEGLEAVEAYLVTHYNKDGSMEMEYLERKTHPLDARPQFGTTGTLFHITNFYEASNTYYQYDLYKDDPPQKGSSNWLPNWLPQARIYGNGSGDLGIGSPIDHNRPIMSIYLGSEDGEMSVFDLISLMGKIPTSYGRAADVRQYLVDNYPTLLYKVGSEYSDKEKKDPNSKICLYCNDTIAHGMPYINVNSRGETVDTVFPFPFMPKNNKPGDSAIIPTKGGIKDKFDSKYPEPEIKRKKNKNE